MELYPRVQYKSVQDCKSVNSYNAYNLVYGKSGMCYKTNPCLSEHMGDGSSAQETGTNL